MLKVSELSFADGQLKAFISLIPVAIAVMDENMRYLAVSDKWFAAYDKSAEDVIGLSHYEIFPETPEHWRAMHQRCLGGEALKGEEEQYKRPDGGIEWVRWEMTPWHQPDGGLRGMILHTEFITEEKRTAQVLLDAKNRAELYLGISGAMILTLGRSGRISQINDSGCQLLGCSRSEAIGHDWFRTFVPARDQAVARAHFDTILSEGVDGIIKTESSVAVRGGRVRIIAWRISIIHDADGNPSGAVLSGEDVTEKRQWEKRNLILSRRNETILRVAGNGIFGIDHNGLATFINPAAARMLGYDVAELIGEPLHDLIHHTKADGTPRDFSESPIMKAAHDDVTQVVDDDVFWQRDGRSFYVEYTATPVNEKDSIFGAVVIFRDVTEQRELQAKLIQSSKMATLGEMATGVAHELNQPLNVIRMAASNIVRKLDKGDIEEGYLRGKLDRIGAQTERAASIIDHMRIFGRSSSGTPESLHVGSIVRRSLDLIGEQLRLSSIAISMDIDDECDGVLGYGVQLEQVILNIFANARDALNENRPSDARGIHVTVSGMKNKSKVRITISDTAGGIDPKIINRIFDPFYTTKKIGLGTGLGLSISYGIIAEMGGTITAENGDKGACFIIDLPAMASTGSPRNGDEGP